MRKLPHRCPEGAVHAISTLTEIYRDWRRYNAGLNELRSLSDRELADIGISRADIYRVAWENACKAA
jgi:uncharacterized protein YjiS (DUF1127 family)